MRLKLLRLIRNGIFSFHIKIGKFHFYIGILNPPVVPLHYKINLIEVNILWGAKWIFKLKKEIDIL